MSSRPPALDPRAIAPMEARLVDALPEGKGWQFEPKWDGFRCLAFRDGERVDLIAKSGKPLGRYFPEVVEAVRGLAPSPALCGGESEIVSPLPRGERAGRRAQATTRGRFV